MSFALKTLEKIKESVDNLSGMVRGLIEKASEETETSVDGEVSEVVGSEATEASPQPVQEKPKMRKTGINRSDLIREYFRKHGMEVKNKDVVASLEKTYNVKIEPSLVSTIRGKIYEDSKKKTSKKTKVMKTKARVQKKDLKGLPMPALCVEVLKQHREGLKWKDVTERVVESGYEYKGKKGYLGIAQNVYQALHALSQKKAHPGYAGKVAVVIHDEPSKRWKLNPKATKSRKIA